MFVIEEVHVGVDFLPGQEGSHILQRAGLEGAVFSSEGTGLGADALVG